MNFDTAKTAGLRQPCCERRLAGQMSETGMEKGHVWFVCVAPNHGRVALSIIVARGVLHLVHTVVAQ